MQGMFVNPTTAAVCAYTERWNDIPSISEYYLNVDNR